MAVTASGTPLDAYDFRVKVTRAAATPSAGAAVKVSLDGGRTYGDEVSIVSGSYAVPNTGVTFAFSAASCVVGDIYRLRTAAPTWDATGLDAALDALNRLSAAGLISARRGRGRFAVVTLHLDNEAPLAAAKPGKAPAKR